MDVLWLAFVALIALGAFVAATIFSFHVWVQWRYGKWIRRIFEEKPIFRAPQASPSPDAIALDIVTPTGRHLSASVLPSRRRPARGTVVFAHEYGATQWLCQEYADYLRDDGLNLVTFDFASQGASDPIEGYTPCQWVTNYEVEDVRAVLQAVKREPSLADLPIGMMGISRGGSAALMAAADDPDIKALVTDGAFPTNGTVAYFIVRFVQIYVSLRWVYRNLPIQYYEWLAADSLVWLSRLHGVEYVAVERAAGRRTCPWLVIHGGRDNYVQMPIVDRFLMNAAPPMEMWVVPKAKHNGCLERAGDEYRRRVREFFFFKLTGAALPVAEPVPVDAISVADAHATNGAHSTNGATVEITKHHAGAGVVRADKAAAVVIEPPAHSTQAV